MRKLSLLVLTTGLGIAAVAQPNADTALFTVYNPLGEGPAVSAELPDEEEGYADYFRPTLSGNGTFLPMGQLSRNLISVRFRPRGYDNRYTLYYLNGAMLSDIGDGSAYWHVISGANLIPHVNDDVSGLLPGRYAPGSVGGVTAVSGTAFPALPFQRFSYAFTNRTYSNRILYSALFPLRREWSVSLGANRRWGRDGFVDGVFTDMTTGTLAVSKRWTNHSLSFLSTGTYGDQGVRSAATRAVYELSGDPYYNPNWGYQNGKLRNAKVRGYRQAFAVLSYEGNPYEQLTLRGALSCFAGRNTFSQPAWYDAPTPYPDYYRYLPGFFGDDRIADPLREQWLSGNTGLTQVNWNDMFEANRYNRSPDGTLRSHYVIRDLVTDKFNTALSVGFTYRYNASLTFSGGAKADKNRSSNYARMKDLMGGHYWLDIDQYLIDDEYYGDKLVNDLRNPDRRVLRGDRFGYNYRMDTRAWHLWGMADYRDEKWQAWLALQVGEVSHEREGKYEKELFPGNLSYGKSGRKSFREYNFKAGLFRHLSFRHRVGVLCNFSGDAPLLRDLFVAPSFRNATVGGLGNIRTAGAEASYRWVMPYFQLDASVYLTTLTGGSQVRSYYDDIESEYLDLIMTGIDRIHGGVEVGVEWAVTPRFSFLAALSWNRSRYDSDPEITLLRDSDGKLLLEGARSYLTGFRLSGSPQTAAMLQLGYRFVNGWNIRGSVKYAGNNYVSVSPVRRMTRALDLAGSPEARREMAVQEKLDDAVSVGLIANRNFRIRNGHSIGLWANVENLLDDRSVRYSGYEQMRFSRTSAESGRTLSAFPSKYYHAYGLNFYCMVSYTF